MAKTGSQKAATALAFAAIAALALALMGEPDLLVRAQRARTLTGLDLGDVRQAAAWDCLFMAAYGGLLVYLFSLIRDPERDPKTCKRPIHPGALAGMVLAVGAVGADAVENTIILLKAFAGDDGNATWLNEMRSAGLFKWGLLGTAVLTLVALTLFRVWRPRAKVGAPTTTPPATEDKWRPPDADKATKKPKKRVVGICLSGGGIRSAAFSLGALQTLRRAGVVKDANYLAAVSGGGYLAAAWALSQAESPTADPPTWDPGSPEERWFRSHSSYLIPNAKGALAGIFRLLAGLAVNVVLVVVLLSAVARPLGWTIHYAFKEFRGHDQPLVPTDHKIEMKVVGFTRLDDVDKGADEGVIARYEVDIEPVDGKSAACFFNPATKNRPTTCFQVPKDEAKRAIVEVQHSRISVVRQPKVKVSSAKGFTPEVVAHPELKVADNGLVDSKDGVTPAAKHLDFESQPLVEVTTGVAALESPKQTRWMWELTAGVAAGTLAAALAVTIFRPKARRGRVLRALARSLGGATAVAALLLFVLPWLAVWLPNALADLSKSGPSLSGSSVLDYVVPGGGLLTLVVTAARQYLNAGAGPKDNEKTGPFQKLRGWSKYGKEKEKELKWYELTPWKIIAGLGSLAALVVVFVNALQFAVVNGPTGELMGFVALADELPSWAFVPDAVELAVMVVALVLFAFVADAHTWSLFPFYKERLSSAFLLQRTGDTAEPLRYDVPVPFTRLATPNGPQLVACCAVNLSDYGVVPPGRRAASFTFSSTEIGGPLVGYVEPEDFEDLPDSRQRDVTVASAMAISGAAFSPAMGKTNLGPVGALLALANLRLGVWLPHPQRVGKSDAGKEWDKWRLRRPHWVWFLRELTNKYKFDRRYLYVSDGGHWDNLGLVELLRRGCNEIYCISGAGDRAESFGTIGEAIALAREELGVEINLDPSDLRAPTTAASPAPKRELRRKSDNAKAAAYAAAGAVKGTIRFDPMRFPNAAEGTIYYVEADLTSEIPFDVHTFAEAEIDFPDDSTGDQVFNHRQFESYRALGAYQASIAVKLANPVPEPPCYEKFKKKVTKKVKDTLC